VLSKVVKSYRLI